MSVSFAVDDKRNLQVGTEFKTLMLEEDENQ